MGIDPSFLGLLRLIIFWEGQRQMENRFEKATEALKSDHRVIERVLAVLERLTESRGEISIEVWSKAVDFIRNFADRCHHLKEEKVFFPALADHGVPLEGGPIGVMLMEHEEGRAYVRAMSEALALGEKDPDAAKKALVQNARPYLRLLREHIMKEDQILFQMAEEILTDEEQKKLLREFEEHEAEEFGAGVHERFLMIAEELEKYRGR